MSSFMLIEEEPGVDELTIRVQGDIDLDNSSCLSGHIESLIGAGVRKLALHLRGVSQVDAVGISVIVAAYERFRFVRGHLRIIGASPNVDRLLALRDLDFLKQAS